MGQCWRCNGIGSYYPTCAFERLEETGHSCPSCPDIQVCDACSATGAEPAQEPSPNALTAARAEGYAEGRAAERADMLAFVADACRLGTQGDALLRALMAKGKHEGAAELGRAAGYAEAVADVVAWLRARAGGLRSHTYGQDDERAVLERVMDGIEDACHVGAAKKGGE